MNHPNGWIFKFGRVILVDHVTLGWLEPHPVSEDAALEVSIGIYMVVFPNACLSDSVQFILAFKSNSPDVTGHCLKPEQIYITDEQDDPCRIDIS